MRERRRFKTENLDGNGDLDERARVWEGGGGSSFRFLPQEAIKCVSVTENRSKGRGVSYSLAFLAFYSLAFLSFHFFAFFGNPLGSR